jgi:hypothetical protein
MKHTGLFGFLICLGCRQYYEPPALKITPDFLVVDGFLTSSPDSTYITLTHTRSLKDTAPGSPELKASLVVEGDQNTITALPEIGNGLYGNLLNLTSSENTALPSTRQTAENISRTMFRSNNPAIDSLTWEQDNPR